MRQWRGEFGSQPTAGSKNNRSEYLGYSISVVPRYSKMIITELPDLGLFERLDGAKAAIDYWINNNKIKT